MLKEILIKRKLKKSKERLERAVIKRIKARSSRVAVEFRIPSKRKFDGIEFRVFDWKTSKSTAEKIAKEQRKESYKIRIIEQKSGDGRKGWSIYIQK